MPEDSAPRTKYFRPASEARSIIAVEGGDDIERERHQFEAEIERDEIIRRDQQQHAERREQDQHRKFEIVELVALQEIDATSGA